MCMLTYLQLVWIPMMKIPSLCLVLSSIQFQFTSSFNSHHAPLTSITAYVISCLVNCQAMLRLLMFTLVFMFLLSCMHMYLLVKLIVNLLIFVIKSHLIVPTSISLNGRSYAKIRRRDRWSIEGARLGINATMWKSLLRYSILLIVFWFLWLSCMNYLMD